MDYPYKGMCFLYHNKIFIVDKVNRTKLQMRDQSGKRFKVRVQAAIHFGIEVNKNDYDFSQCLTPMPLPNVSDELQQHERNEKNLRISTVPFINLHIASPIYRYAYLIEIARVFDKYGIDDSILSRIELSNHYRVGSRYFGRHYTKRMLSGVILPKWWKDILRIDQLIYHIPIKISLQPRDNEKQIFKTLDHELAHLVSTIIYGHIHHGPIFNKVLNEIFDYNISEVFDYANHLVAEESSQSKPELRPAAKIVMTKDKVGCKNEFRGFRKGTKLAHIWFLLHEGCNTKDDILNKLYMEFPDPNHYTNQIFDSNRKTLQVQLSHYKRGVYEWKLKIDHNGIYSIS